MDTMLHHKITDTRLLTAIANLMGLARAVTVVDESPNRNIAGMALASALVNRELADVKTSVYQRIMRDLVRAGIDITKITVMKIANDDTIEYSLSDLVDVMTD